MNDIVQRLREDYCQCVNEPEYRPIRCYTCEAADLIEAQAKEIERREDETAHEVVAARDCEKYERKRAEAAEAEVKTLRTRLDSIDTEVFKHIAESERVRTAEAKVVRLRVVGQKILAKLDHPTASVTQWDADELRKALEAKP
jgi:hypothetical protein